MTLAEFGAAVHAMLPDSRRFSIFASLQFLKGEQVYQTVMVYLHEGGPGLDRSISLDSIETRSGSDDLYSAALAAIEGGAWTRTEAVKPIEPPAVGL